MQAMGAKPTGTADEASAARAVRQMFDAIAPRYDLLNHVLSANVDRLWWRRTARRFRDVLARPEAAILDICCGTGDMTMALTGSAAGTGGGFCAGNAGSRGAQV
jgi:demethylmenaquinone methyltransferase/2-methoxy-6-polyprenyl-1,4-benzoquinol methylase